MSKNEGHIKIPGFQFYTNRFFDQTGHQKAQKVMDVGRGSLAVSKGLGFQLSREATHAEPDLVVKPEINGGALARSHLPFSCRSGRARTSPGAGRSPTGPSATPTPPSPAAAGTFRPSTETENIGERVSF